MLLLCMTFRLEGDRSVAAASETGKFSAGSNLLYQASCFPSGSPARKSTSTTEFFDSEVRRPMYLGARRRMSSRATHHHVPPDEMIPLPRQASEMLAIHCCWPCVFFPLSTTSWLIQAWSRKFTRLKDPSLPHMQNEFSSLVRRSSLHHP